MTVSAEGRVENQKLNQTAALLSFGWVFGFQLDSLEKHLITLTGLTFTLSHHTQCFLDATPLLLPECIIQEALMMMLPLDPESTDGDVTGYWSVNCSCRKLSSILETQPSVAVRRRLVEFLVFNSIHWNKSDPPSAKNRLVSTQFSTQAGTLFFKQTELNSAYYIMTTIYFLRSLKKVSRQHPLILNISWVYWKKFFWILGNLT